MAEPLTPVYFGSFITRSLKKTSTTLAYLDRTEMWVLSVFKKTFWVLWKRKPFESRLMETTWLTKASSFRSKVVTVNFFFSISSSYLIVRIASIVICNLKKRFQSIKLTLTILKIKNDILNIISILRLSNRKVSSKNRVLLFLSFT